MPLTPFEVGSETYSASITMDASTVGETTVTVSVHATRDHEPAVLNAIYDHGADIDFKPFYHKANDFDINDRRAFTENLLNDCAGCVTAFAHHHHGRNEDTQQVEAIHSALLVHDLLEELEDPPIVIVDGNDQQAQPFVDALSGIRDEHPVVGHCQQSELYYPTALLADLASNYLAHCFESTTEGSRGQDLPILAPFAKQARSEDWGRAVSAIYERTPNYAPPALPTQRGNTVRERIKCWYQGTVATDSGVDRPFSDSLTPVITALDREGYDDLARILQDL